MRLSYKEFTEINRLAGYPKMIDVKYDHEEYDDYLNGKFDTILRNSKQLTGAQFTTFLELLEDAEDRKTKMALLQEAIDL